ncbi:MAG: HpaII family restriction endonuclease, partial [Tidjanibacter sp.]|nr:HpaII family restriction endonuclease [Tidjanibacter sp.]
MSNVNPLNYDLSDGHDYYGYKVKTLMVCTALGMLPATTWSGRYDATGGYIVVKNDGDIICFHIYDRNLLEDYLFQNTKFDTPDMKRYEMGQVYKKNGKFYFNLVLQIRFK